LRALRRWSHTCATACAEYAPRSAATAIAASSSLAPTFVIG
jgi:hypothetical protein